MIELFTAHAPELMFGSLLIFLLTGFPVAFALAACGLLFGFIGVEIGLLSPSIFQALPLRVFGSSGTTMIWRGLAIGPISWATWLRSSLTRSSPSWASPRRITNATMPCPVVASLAPTTAASATAGCDTRADSTSVVEMRWPETFITSSTRPSSQMAPSSSHFAPSPAKYMPSNRLQ